jgi:hypothetical protein
MIIFIEQSGTAALEARRAWLGMLLIAYLVLLPE